MGKILIKYCLVLFLFSFLLDVAAQKNVNISGTILNNSGFKKIYLLKIVTKQFTDSSVIDDKGNFRINARIDKIDYYQLFLNQDNYVVLVLLPGDNILVKYDLNNKGYPIVSGSQNTTLFYTSYVDLYNFDKQLEDYTSKIKNDKLDYIRKLIDNNPDKFSCLFFIHQLDIKEDLKYYKKLADGLLPYQGNVLVDDFEKKVREEVTLAVGVEAPEIDLPSLKGNNIKLSSLRGKIVLLDFWASWCKPCRAENPELVSIYQRFHSKGLEIYSVSLDQNKDDWQAATMKDGTGAWVQVSDLKYWNSGAASLYGVQGIPYLVLINKDGKIISKGLSAYEAAKQLDEILK